MRTVTTVAELREVCDAARAHGRTVGFVPTMGYFHDGHRSLMRAARAENDLVVVSLFVNPTQFAPTEDLAAYPRDLEGDAAQAAAEGVDLLFVPQVAEVYLGDERTTVHVGGITEVLCGASRPGHFDGVTTVVTKLLSMVGACRAYFGRKDAQQLAVVRRMTRDLNLPVEVVGCPLVREIDGLAMSSRNAYLTDDDREGALVLCRSLFVLSEAVQRGERDCDRLRALLTDMLGTEPRIKVDYAAIVDAATLEPVGRLDRTDSSETLVALAAFVGRARLIDNVTISVSGEHATVDLGRTAVPAAEER